MRKEILFAIISGLVFGVLIAFGIWRINTSLNLKEDAKQEEVSSDQDNLINELKLILIKPDDLDVITNSPLEIAGATKPDIWIAISSEEEDYIFKSDEKGEFSQEVDLTGGINQILISAFDSDGTSVSNNITVVYSTEFE